MVPSSSSQDGEPSPMIAGSTGAIGDHHRRTASPPPASSSPSILLLKFIFFCLGVGMLVPWNAFISANAYFESRLCGRGHLRNNLESTFAIVYNCSSVFSLGLLLFVQWMADNRHATPTTTVSSTTATTSSNNSSDVGRQSGGTASADSGNSFWLVVVPLSLFFAVFLGQTIAVALVHLDQTVFYVWTVGSLALCGVCTALASSGIFATASLFAPEIAIEPFLEGQSAGGLGVSLVNFMAAAFEEPSDFWNSRCVQDSNGNGVHDRNKSSRITMEEETADDSEHCHPYTRMDYAVLCYFLLGSLVLAGCIVGYTFIDRYEHDVHRDEYEAVEDDDRADPIQDNRSTPEEEEDLIQDDRGTTEEETQSPLGVEMSQTRLQRRQTDRDSDAEDDEEEQVALEPDVVARGRSSCETLGDTTTFDSFEYDPTNMNHPDDTENESAEVLRIVKSPALAIFAVLFVTLSLFPEWISQLRSAHECTNPENRWQNDLYTPFAFVLFNAGDLTGRILSGYLDLSIISRVSTKILSASVLRCLFFPLLFLCASHLGSDRWTIDSDFYSLAVQLAFALSNGFVLSTAFVYAPCLLPDVKHFQERSAEMLNFALYLGLLGGSLFSMPVSNLFAS